ncbi:MAG: hypothetical protein R3E66_20235 [bacterium]
MTTDLRDLQILWRDQPGNYELFISLGQAYVDAVRWRDVYHLYVDSRDRFGTLSGYGAQLVGHLRSIAEILDDAKERGELLVAIGDALWEFDGNRDEAMKAFQESYVVYPEDTTCLDRARAIYRRSGDFERVLLLFKLELKKKTDAREKARVLTRVAQVYGDDLRNHQKAVEVLEQVIEHDPENPDAEELFDLYAEGKTIFGVIQELVKDAREHRKTHPGRAAEHFVQSAHLERLRDAGTLEQALEYASEAVSIDPNHDEAQSLRREILAELGREDESSGVSVVGYVNVIEEAREPENTQDEAREPSEPESVQGETPQQDDAAAEEAAAEEAAAEEAAAEEAAVVAHPEPDEKASTDDDGAVAPAAQEDDDLSEDSDEDSDAEDIGATRILSAAQRSQIEEQDSQAPASAEADSLDRDPTNLTLLRALRDEAVSSGTLDGAIARYEDAIKKLRKKDGELEAMSDLAALLWEQKKDLDAAEYWYKRIKLLDAENPKMLDFYEAWFEREEEWPKLFALLSTAQQHAESDERRLAITQRLASLAENEMESADKAINVWKAYVRQTGDDADARAELIRLYQAHEKWSALVDIYKDELADAQTDRKLELLHVMADLYETKLNLEPMVIMCLQQTLELAPSHQEAFSRLRSLLENNRRFNDLTHLLAERAESAAQEGDVGTAVELFADVAAIWQDQLKNVTQALPYLEKIVDLDPDNEQVIARLKDVYEQRRDFKSLFELMRKEAARLDGDERLEKLQGTLRLAQDRVRDPELIAPLLEEILELDPQNLDVIDQLETQLRKAGDAPKLADLLLKKADLTQGSDRDSIRAEAASLLAATDLDRSVEIWRDVLKDDPTHNDSFASLSMVLVDGSDWDGLQELYASAKRFDALWDLFDSAAGTSDASQTKTELYRRMATIADEELDAPDRVILSLEALRAHVDDPDSIARELVPWYQRIGDVDREIAMHRTLFEASDEPGTRFKEALKIRSLEVSRGEHGNALQWSLEALRIDPLSSDALDAADESARAGDTLELLVTSIDDLAQTLADPTAQESLWKYLAKVEWHDLNRLDDAVAHTELISERHPDDLELLGNLEQLHALMGHGSKRIDVLRRQIDVLTERGATRADLIDELSKIADVQRTELNQKDDARATYSEILDIDPSHLASLRGLKELYREDQRWEDVAECLIREINLSATEAPERRVQCLMELGDLYRTELGDSAEALRQYATVLSDDPSNDEAVNALEALLAEPDRARDAALLLEPIFRDLNRPAELIRALEARRTATNDRFEEQEILDELIPLYIAENDNTTAFERACRQVELDVERSEIWLRLEQLGARLNRWGDIERVFSQFAPTDTTASATRFDMLRHLAAIREYQLNMKADALAAWELLYEYDPMESAHVEALERLYRQLGRHAELVTILVAKAALLDEPESKALTLGEAARVSDEVLADSPRTIEILQKLIEVDPDSEAAVSSLRRLFASEERFQELADLLADQAASSNDREKRKIYLAELARTRFDHLEDPAGAIETLELVLSENPSDSDILALLETFDAQLAERPEAIATRLDLLAIAEPLYRAAGNDNRLIEILRVKLLAEEADYERVALLDELTEALERIGRLPEAFDAVALAVEMTPDDHARRLRLEEIGLAADRGLDVVTVLRTAASNADPVTAGEIYVRIAELLNAVDHDEEAIEAYEKALSVNESDERSLLALENLYERADRYEDLASVLHRSSIFGDPGRRVDVLRRLAMVEDEILNRPEQALQAWTELSEAEPDAADALDALERLHERGDRWTDVADVLERKASTVLDPDVQVASWLKLAQIRETKLNDVPAAIETLNQVVAADPTARQALDELERLYAEQSQWNELSDILRMKLSSATDGEQINTLEIKLANVLASELFATEDALALYRSVLSRRPGHPEAIAALEAMASDDTLLTSVAEDLVPHYASTQNWAELVDLYERLLERALDPAEQATFAHEIALVQRDGLEDMAAARKAFSRAWLLDLDNTELRNELIELVVRDSDWSSLAQTYSDALMEAQNPDVMMDLHMRLAQLQRDQLGDDEAAERHLREVLLLDETHAETYEDLERLLSAQERWFDLAELLDARYSAFASEPDAHEILVRLATVQDEFLGDAIAATDTYVRVLQTAPDDSRALRALNRLYRAQQRWDDLSQLLIQQAAYAKTEEQVALRLELCDLMAHQAESPALAIDYAREVFDLDPENADALNIMESLFENPMVRADVAALLEPIYRRRGDVDGLLRALEAAADSADEPATRAMYLREIAVIHEDQRGDADAARRAYAEVFAVTPDDSDVRTALERLAARNQAWQGLTDIYQQTLRDNFDIGDELRVTLLGDLASMFESRLEQLDDAERTLQDLLLVQADNEHALDALERIYSRTENWHGLGDLYRRRADLAHDPDAKRDFLESLAGLYEDVLGDSDAAIDVYNEIIGSNPDDVPAHRALERLLHYAARWLDLADLYRQRSEFTNDPHESLEYRFRLAQLLDTELDQLDEALELHREILTADPQHAESRRALEGLSRDLATREGDWAEHRVQIIDLLLTTYDPVRDRERILSFLEQKASLVEDAATRVALFVELATNLEASSRSEDRSQAVTFLAQAYQLDPYADDVRRRLEALADETNAWERLIPIFLAGLEFTDDVEAQIRLLRTCADVLSGPLRDRESAIAAWQQILAIDPNHEDAMAQLERLYGELELWKPLVDILTLRVDAIYEQDAQERLLRRIASVQVDVLGDAHSGIETWNRLFEMNPARLEYIQQLEGLYEQESMFEELEELLRAKINLVDDGTPRLTVLRKLAHIQDEILRDNEGAIETWAQILETEPTDLSAAQALVRLYEAVERWPELLDALEALRKMMRDEVTIAGLDLKTAHTLLVHLEAPYDAMAHVAKVLERFPDSEQARTAMAALLERPETREEAAAYLKAVYRKTEEWRELEGLFERMLEVTEDSLQREKIYLELADVQRDEIGQPAVAFVTYGRALRDLPNSPDVRSRIEVISEELGNQDELIAVYEDCLDAIGDDISARRSLSERLGVLYYQLEEHADAIRHFEAVLEADAYDGAALDHLDKLYQITRNWTALEGVLERELTIAHPARVNDVRFRLGYLREVVFERVLDGFDLYRQVVIDEPTHAGAVDAINRLADVPDLCQGACALLEPIFQDSRDWERLSRILMLKLETQDHASERAMTLERLGDIEANELGRPSVAYAYYGRSLREEPNNTDVQARLEALAADNELHEELVALYEDIIAELNDPIRIVEFALVAGRVAAENLGAFEESIKLYRKVLDLDVENRTAIEALEAIARHQGNSEALANVLQRKADVTFEPDERFAVLVELGRVRNVREEFDLAIDAYRDALLIDESSIDVMMALVDLLEITEQYASLVELLQRLVQFVDTNEERFTLFVRTGQYQRVLLKDPYGALDAYRAALDYQPDNTDVLVSLDELYVETENHEALREVLLRRLELAEPSERLGLLVRSATLSYEKFSDLARAIEDFEAAMQIDANDPGVIAALDRLYRAEHRWDDVLALYDRVIADASHDLHRVCELRVTMADIYANHMGRPDDAIAQLNAVLELNAGHNGALTVLADLHEKQGDWSSVLEILSRQAAASPTNEERAAAYLRRAQIHEQLNDPANAATDYVRVIELFPTHEVAMPSLKALYQRLEAYEQLYAMLEFEAAYRADAEKIPLFRDGKAGPREDERPGATC